MLPRLTGDGRETARAIGAQVGLLDGADGAGHEKLILSGAELDQLMEGERPPCLGGYPGGSLICGGGDQGRKRGAERL